MQKRLKSNITENKKSPAFYVAAAKKLSERPRKDGTPFAKELQRRQD